MFDMAQEELIRRYRNWYAKLLRFYSKPYYDRFGGGMEQTFTDLLRERSAEESGLFGYACWMFIETAAGIVKENIREINMQSKTLIRTALVTAFILLIPLLAMQFTDEVIWDLADFAVAGVLLIGAGLMVQLVATRGGNTLYRAAVGIAMVAALLLIWMNLAVGLIGSEDNPPNLIYAVVLTVGFIGAVIGRLQPDGMARALVATALAQALATVIALVLDTRAGVLFINAFFLMLFAGSALLFRRARFNGLEAKPMV